MITGHEYPRASGLSENLSREDHPHIGSALTAVEGRRDKAVPPFVTVPDYIAVNCPIRAGQHAGFLGGRYDPLVPPLIATLVPKLSVGPAAVISCCCVQVTPVRVNT